MEEKKKKLGGKTETEGKSKTEIKTWKVEKLNKKAGNTKNKSLSYSGVKKIPLETSFCF